MIKAKIVAVDEVTSKAGNKYYRLWVVTENQPRPMRVISRKAGYQPNQYINISIEPDYQCNASVKVVD